MTQGATFFMCLTSDHVNPARPDNIPAVGSLRLCAAAPTTASRSLESVDRIRLTRMSKRSDPFTVLVEQDEEGYFVATVPELRGCHTQAKSLDVLMRRVQEAIALSLADESRPPRRTFIAVQQVRVT